MPQLFVNNAAATLAANIGPSDSLALLSPGQGSLFPSPDPGQWFYVTLVHVVTGDYEVCQCTARTGDTLTLTRGVDNTTAISFVAGTVVEHRACAQTLRELDWATLANQPGGPVTLDPTGRVPIARLPSDVPVLNGGKLPVSVIPDEVATDVDVVNAIQAAANARVAKAGDDMSGQLRILNGAPSTQSTKLAWGWNDNNVRWAWVMEPGSALSLYSYNSDATSSSVALKIDTPQSNGESDLYFLNNRVWHAGNFNPDTKLTVNGNKVESSLEVRGLTTTNSIRIADRDNFSRGTVLFGTGNPAPALHWDGDKFTFGNRVVHAADFVATSDRQHKDLIEERPPKLGVANKVSMCDFVWKSDRRPGRSIIAQEVMEYAPEHVVCGDAGMFVDKAGLALDMIQDLAFRVAQLEAKLKG